MSAPAPPPGRNLPILEFLVSIVFGVALWTLLKPGFDTAKNVGLNTTSNGTAVQGIQDTAYIFDNLLVAFVLIGFFGLVVLGVFLGQ